MDGSTVSSKTFFDLPLEMQKNTIDFLQSKDLVTCLSVSKFFNTLVLNFYSEKFALLKDRFNARAYNNLSIIVDKQLRLNFLEDAIATASDILDEKQQLIALNKIILKLIDANNFEEAKKFLRRALRIIDRCDLIHIRRKYTAAVLKTAYEGQLLSAEETIAIVSKNIFPSDDIPIVLLKIFKNANQVGSYIKELYVQDPEMCAKAFCQLAGRENDLAEAINCFEEAKKFSLLAGFRKKNLLVEIIREQFRKGLKDEARITYDLLDLPIDRYLIELIEPMFEASQEKIETILSSRWYKL